MSNVMSIDVSMNVSVVMSASLANFLPRRDNRVIFRFFLILGLTDSNGCFIL